jgi:hypothetical protein
MVCTAWPEGQTMWNDTELQHDIENEVGWELSAGLTQISVTVKSGAVELGGHVDSFWEKCAAERAAWRVAHVNHVTNGIRVVVPFNKQRDDDDIALAAMRSLEWNCLVPETVPWYQPPSWSSLAPPPGRAGLRTSRRRLPQKTAASTSTLVVSNRKPPCFGTATSILSKISILSTGIRPHCSPKQARIVTSHSGELQSQGQTPYR